ncbi:MAG: polyprenyl synthetase family protein [Solirubrobacteraceae bacterium]
MSTVGGTAQERAMEDEDAVTEIMRRGGPELRERMARVEEHLERVAAEAGAPLAVHATSTVLAGGKRLRPLLVVLAATAACGPGPSHPDGTGAGVPGSGGPGSDGAGNGSGSGRPPSEKRERDLVRAAVAVELVHSATLVHDDVIDGALLRRGHPSVVAQAGRRMAIATGDLLFSRAFAELALNAEVAQLRALSDASSALAAGELLQREDAYAPKVAVERYLHRCELKTAALFEAACRLGALVASGGAERESSGALADALGAFARRIGLAFQLLDDVLDVSGPVERTGKTRGTDLLDGTVTLPLILARERDERLAEVDLASLAGPEQAGELCERIAATGALREARERALALVAEAKAMLPEILPNGGAALLDLVADAVVERYR